VPTSQELLADGAIPQPLAQTALQAAERVDIYLQVAAALDICSATRPTAAASASSWPGPP